MACRELRLPAGVSVLHVEQEVTGDNTLALDSVLECDTERVQLLASGDKDTTGRCVPGEGGSEIFPCWYPCSPGVISRYFKPQILG